MRAFSFLALAFAALTAAAPSDVAALQIETGSEHNGVTLADIQAAVGVNATLAKRTGSQGVYLAHCKVNGQDAGLAVLYYPNIYIATQSNVLPTDLFYFKPLMTDYKTRAVGVKAEFTSPNTGVSQGFYISKNWGNTPVGGNTGTAWNEYGLHMTCKRGTDHTFFNMAGVVCMDWQHCDQDN